MSTIVPDDDNGTTIHLNAEQIVMLPACEVCGEPVREQRCEPVDRTDVLRDSHQVMIPGQAYNEPCNCPIPGTEAQFRYVHFRSRYILGADFSDHSLTEARPRGRLTITDHSMGDLDRTPSGEHTSADTDDVVADIDDAIEGWEDWMDGDAARWSPDGSHEHDPPFWTRLDHGNGARSGAAEWGCDDVAERMQAQGWHEPEEPLPALTWHFADEEPVQIPSTRCFPWRRPWR